MSRSNDRGVLRITRTGDEYELTFARSLPEISIYPPRYDGENYLLHLKDKLHSEDYRLLLGFERDQWGKISDESFVGAHTGLLSADWEEPTYQADYSGKSVIVRPGLEKSTLRFRASGGEFSLGEYDRMIISVVRHAEEQRQKTLVPLYTQVEKRRRYREALATRPELNQPLPDRKWMIENGYEIDESFSPENLRKLGYSDEQIRHFWADNPSS